MARAAVYVNEIEDRFGPVLRVEVHRNSGDKMEIGITVTQATMRAMRVAGIRVEPSGDGKWERCCGIATYKTADVFAWYPEGVPEFEPRTVEVPADLADNAEIDARLAEFWENIRGAE